MEVFALGMKIKEEGAATVSAALKKVRADLKDTAKGADEVDRSFAKLKLGAIAVGAAIGGAIVGAMALTIRNSIESQKVQAQLAAALRSTGAEAWTSAEALNAHAAALQRATAFGDEAIGEAQALLLTFTRIGRDAFPRATAAILDVATAMGSDLKSAAIQVGKALNDPILGVTALARSGIQFSDSQKATITRLVETNRLVEAQNIILAELQVQFGGSAVAARDTLGGALKALGEVWGDLFELTRQESGGMIAAINGTADAVRMLQGVVNGTLAYITGIGASFVRAINVIWIAFQRFGMNMGGFIANVLLAPLTLIPFVGRDIALAVDKLNQAIDASDKDFAAQQQDWKDWEAAVYRRAAGVDTLTASVTRNTKAIADNAATAASALKAMPAPGASATSMGWLGEGMRNAVDGAGVTTLPDPLKQAAGLSLDQARAKLQAEAALLAKDLEENLAENIAGAITMGLVAGIEAGVASGSIGEGFASLTAALLSGLGSSMIEFGVASLKLAALMDGLLSSFMNLLPGGATAKALAMIALGAALKGAARGAFGGRGTSGGGFGSGASPAFSGPGGLGGSNDVTRLLFGATSAGTAAGMTPRQALHVTVIGPDDPNAQRAIEELIRKSQRRGSL